MSLSELRERLRRVPPAAADAVVAAAVALGVSVAIAARQEPDAAEPDALAYLVGVAIAAPLLVRRRRPLGGFLVSAALVMAYHALGYPAIGLAAPLAVGLYSAARAGRALPALAVMLLLEVNGFAYQVLVEGGSLVSVVGSQLMIELLLIAALLLLAEALRSRRAWMDEVTERLRRTEEEREREAQARLEAERRRIAREMHDVLAHTVAVIGVQAGVAAEAVADAPDEARAALGVIREKSREAMAEIRAAVGVLREPGGAAPRAPAPGLARLEDLVGAAEAADLRVEVSVSGRARPLPGAVDLTAYRIVQESLTNVLRHARAGVARVAIGYEPGALVVEVGDDGAGHGGRPPAVGHGLAGMRERAAALGGRLEAGPGDGAGFRVRAWLPTAEGPT
ncbi:sensor histidine kinase [Miltoncostaea marina]|uniref:sensor histidine kinase n=1 Tax=Miltoncostaea marina TaxID=2843215 RepID=UPI001C3C6FAA|nr:sensor histidine kinase [Miltoncostaea marina]